MHSLNRQSPHSALRPSRFLSLLLLFLFALTAPLAGWAQNRAQALLQFEGVQARYQAAYAPGAVARDAQQQLEPPDLAMAGSALKALDAAASKSFNTAAAMAAVQSAVAAAGHGGAAPDAPTLRAVAHLVKIRAEYAAMNDATRAEFFKQQQAVPPDAVRTELLDRMAVADTREVDFSSQLLMTAVVKQLARGNAGQFTSLPERTLDSALESLWSRGVTSTRQRNMLIVARELERQITQAQLVSLSNEEAAALLAWRNDPQAAAERDALVDAYKAEVKAGGARAIRAVLRAWPRQH